MATSANATRVQQSLRDIVLGMLSLAAMKGTTKVPLTEFYGAFEAIVKAHPKMFPPMHFRRTAYSVYSRRLDDALQSIVGYSVDLPNPHLQFFEVDLDTAKRHLTWLNDKYGEKAVNELKPLTEEFLRLATQLPEKRALSQ